MPTTTTKRKTGGSMKPAFPTDLAAAAAAQMPVATSTAAPAIEPAATPAKKRGAPKKEPMTAFSARLPSDVYGAVFDEALQRSTQQRRQVAMNDVLVEVMRAWADKRAKGKL